MAKITIAGDALIVTSAFTLEDLKKLLQYKPKALSLYEVDEETGKKCEVFKVGVSDRGSLSTYGANFCGTSRDGEGNATITLSLPDSTKDAVGYVSEEYGAPLMALNAVEEQFEDALAAIEKDQAAILENITVI